MLRASGQKDFELAYEELELKQPATDPRHQSFRTNRLDLDLHHRWLERSRYFLPRLEKSLSQICLHLLPGQAQMSNTEQAQLA